MLRHAADLRLVVRSIIMPPSLSQFDTLHPSRPNQRQVIERWPPGRSLAVILGVSLAFWVGLFQLTSLAIRLAG